MKNKIIRSLVFMAGLLACVAGAIFFSSKLKDEWVPPIVTPTSGPNLPFALGPGGK